MELLIKNYGYVHDIKKFVWLKNVKKAIKFLNNNNYKSYCN